MSFTSIAVPARSRRPNPRQIFTALFVAILLVSFGLMGIQYHGIGLTNGTLARKIAQMSDTKPVSAINTPEDRADIRGSLVPVDKASVAELIEKIRSIALVPVDEAPSLATVIDTAKILDQPFFRNAQVDDKLFVYSAARTAVLYRPSEGKLVNMAYLVEEGGADTQAKVMTTPQIQGAQTSASSEAQQQSKVAVYYSTDSASLRSKVGKALLTIPSVEVVHEALTRGQNFKGTSVIDVRGGHTTLVASIVKALQGIRGTMPPDEDVPDADVLIIAGE